MLQLEGGAHAAQLVLARYNRDDGTWDQPRSGEFWDAVAAAHERGDTGAGRRVAVVDNAFDTSVPALARQNCVWPSKGGGGEHGTAVALLILQVAPDAQLDLYPVGAGDGLDQDGVRHAVRLATLSGAEIVNLSLGEPFPIEDVLDLELVLRGAQPWPELTQEDVPWFIADALRANGSWRSWLKPVPGDARTSALAVAVREAVDAGATVVAAAGNEAGHVFSPALLPGVFAASYIGVQRYSPTGEGEESAAPVKPFGYSQSDLADFSLVQPPLTLGSSFAAPLISGFAALLPDRTTLARHRDSAFLASLGSDLLNTQAKTAIAGSDRRTEVLAQIYTDAVNAAPHPHFKMEDLQPCPECAFFAAPTYIDGGLVLLRSGYLEGAVRLLTAAVLFAPRNPHATANLAMAYAVKANMFREAGDREEMVAYLTRAEGGMRAAVQLLPTREDFRVRAEEFSGALRSPGSWQGL